MVKVAQENKLTNQYINGEWVEGKSNHTIVNINPYTEEEIFTIQCASKEDVDLAYQSALASQSMWEQLNLNEKLHLFDDLTRVLLEKKDYIIEWLVNETGSTILKASVEFGAVLSMARESSSFMTRMSGTILPSFTPGKENRVYRSAKGVVGVISPWNFPFTLSMRSVLPALATGNTVVIKPASDAVVTSGLLIAELFDLAGFPKGVVNVVVGKGSEIGDAFVEHPIPALISFTGSTEVGRRIGEIAGKNLKDVALELGGNNAMIVLDDANIEQAAKAAAFGSFLHQGQICMALNRIIVTEKNHDTFVEEFTKVVENIKAGDPSKAENLVGPLINKAQVSRIQSEIEKSVELGATVKIQGEIKGCLMGPTVLVDVTNDMPIAQNEIFGPAVPIIKVKNEEDAIEVANASEYGLSGSVFTENLERGVKVAHQIKTGMIHINDQSVNDEAHMPFGGEKASGVGRFNGEWAIEKFTTVKWISIQHEYRNFPV